MLCSITAIHHANTLDESSGDSTLILLIPYVTGPVVASRSSPCGYYFSVTPQYARDRVSGHFWLCSTSPNQFELSSLPVFLSMHESQS